jgi:hypothetical protein
VGIGQGGDSYVGSDLSLEDISEAARLFGFLNSFNITGGEPTLHARFDEVVRALDEFQCQRFHLETNGYGFRKWPPELFLKFDLVAVTRYGGTGYATPGTPSNADDIEFMRQFLDSRGVGNRLAIAVHSHTPRKYRAGNTCSRASGGTVSYWNKSVYPCCTAQGMRGAVGIPLTSDWRREIMEVDLPCDYCIFHPAL